MTKTPALNDDDLLLPANAGRTTREKFKAALERRYSPRLHMSCILAASGLTAMLASTFLLGFGVDSMVVRYPIAITLAYATFLVGVWTWLRVMGFVDNDGTRKSSLDGSSILDIRSGGGSSGGSGGGGLGRGGSVFGGRGGGFDGGGASASFAEGRAPLMATNLEANASSGSGLKSAGGKAAGSLLDGLDGDGVVLLVLAIALVAAVFVTSGYLIWCAPDVLTEAAFGAMLTGTLARRTKEQTTVGWIGGVLKKTWWPFAVVLIVACVFASYAHNKYPQASTFRQAIAAAFQKG